MVLFAQATDALSGGAGWAGAGLLGAVLSWLLLVHLPAKDKFIKDLVEYKDKQLSDILTQKWKTLEKMGEDFKTSLADVAAHCQQEMAMLTQFWRRELELLAKARRDDRDKTLSENSKHD